MLEGRSNRGGGALPHTITFTVTGLTKVINGVNVRILWDVDVNSGQLVETELSFFAEDGQGNIWLFGEYPEEYEGGLFKGAPNTWLAGLSGSEPGIQVPAFPKLSGPSYIQAIAPEVGFFDCGKDIMKNQSACVPVGCFNDVLVVEEWNPDDPVGGFQRKYYAPWVGNIQVGAVNDPEGETLVLGTVNELSRKELRQANAEALKLDERAYLVSDNYRQTEPPSRAACGRRSHRRRRWSDRRGASGDTGGGLGCAGNDPEGEEEERKEGQAVLIQAQARGLEGEGQEHEAQALRSQEASPVVEVTSRRESVD